MARSAPKLTLNGSRDIPFDRLVLSQSNVRRVKAGVSIGELAERPLPWLIERFGVRGEWFHRLAAGEDERGVEVSRKTKSISSETTFAADIGDLDAGGTGQGTIA